MTPDEYEARLRDEVLWSVCLRKDDPVVEARLDAYADWLRLRAVTANRCHRLQGIEEWQEYGDSESCETMRAYDAAPEQIELCPVCDAERKVAEILAAAEVTA